MSRTALTYRQWVVVINALNEEAHGLPVVDEQLRLRADGLSHALNERIPRLGDSELASEIVSEISSDEARLILDVLADISLRLDEDEWYPRLAADPGDIDIIEDGLGRIAVPEG